MLKLILGRAGTGKSYTVFENIKADAAAGKNVVMLVPEQFTFECERTLLRTLGDRQSTAVQVLSFTRLYDEVTRKVGGRVADIINDSDRIILMGRALYSVANELELWGKYASSAKFAQTLLTAITEFKTDAVMPEDLNSVADKLDDGYLKSKVHDVALIYSAYNAVLANEFLDPQDNTERLAEDLLTNRLFENKTVYVDSFKGFTGQQYKIIDRILNQADDVTFSFTAPDLDYKKIDIFSGVRKTVDRILKIAENNRVTVTKPLILTEFHYADDTMRSIESIFSDRHTDICDNGESVTICKCANIFDEAEFTARSIRRLVRREGYRYRDFVIIARDDTKYRQAVLNACNRNGVFCFSDKRSKINNMPLTVLINSYFRLCRSYNNDVISDLLKTRLGPVSDDAASEIENYMYIWSVRGKQWLGEWKMNPSGLLAREMNENEKKELAEINAYREKIVNSVEEFKKRFHGTPEQMSLAVVNLVEKLNIREKMKSDFSGDDELSNDVRQCYDLTMQVLNSLVKCMPDAPTTTDEYIKNWTVAAESVTFGNIPQMLDEVTFGSADRIRPSRPKIAFIIGAYQDEFPKRIHTDGVFADSEREKLRDGGLDILATDFTRAIDEEYLVYTSLCCPSQKLYITYPTYVGAGTPTEPSEIIKEISGVFDKVTFLCEPDKKLTISNIPETQDTAVAAMCRYYSINAADSKIIENVLKEKSGISVEGFIKNSDKQSAQISIDTAAALYGRENKLSATKFDVYHKCRFAYFCKYGLKAKKLQQADLNVLQRGTIVHYVLEKLISEYGKDVCTLTREQTDALVDRYIKEYLNSVEGFGEMITERIKFLIGKISVIVKEVAHHLAVEFAQAQFSPDYCELKIGTDGTVAGKVIDFTDGKFVLDGSIDRVDVWNGYLRVVDYKTNSKDFRLSDTLMGLNMQMLIYLYALIRSDDAVFSKMTPSGVLYMPARREKEDKKLTMQGIVLDSEQVYTAMEQENQGEFIPKHTLLKSGAPTRQTERVYVSPTVFDTVFDYIEKLIKDMGREISSGQAQAVPTDLKDENDACKYCDYYSICRIENGRRNITEDMNNAQTLEKIREVL